MKFTELRKHLLSGELKPCYYIYGDDSFVARSAKGMFEGLIEGQRELNVAYFGKDATAAEIEAAALAPPLLANRRVVFVEDCACDLAPLERYFAAPSKTTTLVFIGTPAKSAEKFITRYAEPIDCDRLGADYIRNWAVRKSAANGRVISERAAALLVDYCARDMNRVYNELEKLFDYSGGEPIDEAAVEALVAPEPELKVFELSEALSDKDKARAMTLMQSLLEDNSPVSLLGMLFNHFRRLLFVSLDPQSDTLASDLKVKEGAIRIALKQSKRFTQRRLKAIVDRLNFYDNAIKSGAFSDEDALVAFVCETANAV